MKRKTHGWLPLAAAVFFTVAAMISGGIASAAYVGDGAAQNAVGGWTKASAGPGCTGCHDATVMNAYLMTGHKNMLRKVTAPLPWAGPDGTEYSTDQSGNPLDWTLAKIGIGGTPKDLYYIFSGWMGEGPWSPRALYDGGYNATTGKPIVSYSCGRCHATGWSSDNAINYSKKPETDFPGINITWDGTTLNGGGKINLAPGIAGDANLYSSWSLNGVQCERCHGEGGHLATNLTILPNPSLPASSTNGWCNKTAYGTSDACTAAGFTWQQVMTTGTCTIPAYTNQRDCEGHGGAWNWTICVDPAKTTSTTCPTTTAGDASALQRFRFQTSRTNNVVKPLNSFTTDLCMNCHRQETSGWPNTYTGGVVNAPTGDTTASAEPGKKLLIGGHGAYAREFDSHPHGNMFLNSPHARFSGTFNQISAFPGAAPYESHFFFYGGGCTTCHDVHESTVAAVNAEPIRAAGECGVSCHQARKLEYMNHPSGAGTPLGDMTDIPKACETCHMPDGMHLFRISVDAGYATFPDAATFYGGSCTDPTKTTSASCTAAGGTWTPVPQSKIANTAPDGDFGDAVWVDLDVACGQCHGGGTDSTTSPAPSAVYMNKATLAGLAKNIHNAVPAVNFTWSNDSAISYKVKFDGSSTVCPPGAACNYTWDFGDGSCATTPAPAECTGAVTSHIYADAAQRTATLTVDTYGTYYTSASASQDVTPVRRCSPPTPSATLAVSGMTVTVVDNSTDAIDAQSVLKVTVTWGDGTSTTQAAGTTFSKTYAAAGTFTVTHRVVNICGSGASADLSPSDTTTLNARVTVPDRYTVSGTVTRANGTTPLSGVAIYLRQSGALKYIGSTKLDGTYTISNVGAGTYDVVPAKAGYTFTPASRSVTVGPNATGLNFQSNQ